MSYPRWAGTKPQEFDPDLDDVLRAELGEVDPMHVVVRDALDEWATERHGVCLRVGDHRHGVGGFLDRLAAEGYRVTRIEAPSLEDVLPVVVD